MKYDTKILDKEGDLLVVYNRSHTNFKNFKLGKRNLKTKFNGNELGFFFSDNENLENYGPHIKKRYLKMKKPFDLRELGQSIDYKTFKDKLVEIGITNKDLAGFDLDVQDMHMGRNKKLGDSTGLHNPSGTSMYNTKMAIYNFFDAGNGFYIRKLLEKKGFDGVIFNDGGTTSFVAFYPEQIIKSKKDFESSSNLEEKVAASVFAMFVFAGLFFGASSLTGAVIGFSKSFSMPLGIILFVLGLLGLFNIFRIRNSINP